ncbi:UNVERIFIED_CONTAM: hypothetical protein PYX00_003178 [Menopon gallinae]|uniref:Cadherin domain-containing protein n=1 Tax=Menopon gallinae TaxID=328185 RepID=A0AAW2I0X5_9NEOP
MVVLHDQDVEIVDSSENKLKRYNALADNRNAIQLPPMISLPETIPAGTAILRLLADDRDANSTVSYRIQKEIFFPRDEAHNKDDHASKKHFVIDSGNGEVAVATTLRPEAEYRLIISAFDSGGFTDNVTVRIFVKDVNDHAPVFSESSYDFDLLEGVYTDRHIGKVHATDGDYDENANVTYSIVRQGNDAGFPFRISPTTGDIFVTGDIDREARASHVFKVTAEDQASEGRRLSSTVDVEVHVADVNDNAPAFYGYDRLLEVPRSQLSPGDSEFDSDVLVPVYYTSVQENSPLGTPIAKLYANDSDFQGNGNGLLLFDVLHRKNAPLFFEIDSKDGIVTVTNKLDYEKATSHNLTIVASDLGKPSLSSTALLVVNVIDVPEEKEEILGPMFNHRYYEVEIEENSAVPLPLLTVNVSENFRGQSLKYSISPSRDSESFSVNPINGTLYLITKPDRETKSKYEVKVRVDRVKRGRGMATFIYPPPKEKVADLGPNEVKVVVRVKDVNDNSPMFKLNGRPIIAAVPKTANYGYEIVKLQATDPDEGLNGEVRYQIMGRLDDDSHKFSIDPVTGQVRSVVSFAKDVGKVYGFDVRAVDRRGADNGRSAITNVFVYILDDEKQVTMVLGSKPTLVERNMDTISGVLYNITGLDVRARKIEPHIESDEDDGKTTDVYLYAVDPIMNVLVEMDMLHSVLEGRSREIKKRLDQFNVKSFQYVDEPMPARPRAQRSLLSALEVAVVVLGCVVFIGAMTSAICVGCVKRSKRR